MRYENVLNLLIGLSIDSDENYKLIYYELKQLFGSSCLPRFGSIFDSARHIIVAFSTLGWSPEMFFAKAQHFQSYTTQ